MNVEHVEGSQYLVEEAIADGIFGGLYHMVAHLGPISIPWGFLF